MNYSRHLKYLFKIAILLIGAAIVEPFLTMAVILKLGPWIRRLSPNGPIIMIIVETIGIPLFIVAIFAGVLGGLWLRGRTINGFLLSLGFYLYWFGFTVAFYPLKVDLVNVTLFLGFPLVTTVGTLIYAVVAKRMNVRAARLYPKNGIKK